MSEERGPRIITPMPTQMVQAIDDYRFTARLASRAEAIRRLIEAGLKAEHSGTVPVEKAGA
jgi:metal-responsive CopG/Arc/MetJ family transcriptional regulator